MDRDEVKPKRTTRTIHGDLLAEQEMRNSLSGYYRNQARLIRNLCEYEGVTLKQLEDAGLR